MVFITVQNLVRIDVVVSIILQVLVFCEFGLKKPIHTPFSGFWGHISSNNVTHRSNPKRVVLGRHLSHEARISAARFGLGVGARKKDRTGKSQRGYISPICGEAPIGAISMKNCVVGDVLDVITCAKFQNEIFRGYDFTGGRISIFLLIFEWALRQCSATALPVK